MGGELEDFLTFIYGEEKGYAYSPTKDLQTGAFEQYFFEWPAEKMSLIDHILTHTAHREVYYSPGLFEKAAKAEKEDVKGSSVIWCEFDGTLPTEEALLDIPQPHLKIQSSTKAHEHWYWKLDKFENPDIIEELNKKIVYKLGADFCWNSNRVLRPVGSKHHESSNTVTALRWDKRQLSLAAFGDLPELPFTPIESNDIKTVPSITEVVLKYAFPTEAMKLYREPKERVPVGHRSSAMTKMAHFCVEMGMKTPEILSVLYNIDNRWGKWANHNKQRERLLGIINHVLTKHNKKAEEPKKEKFRVFSFGDFMAHEVKFNWLIPELLSEAALFNISGPPRVGKTQISLRLLEKLAKGEKWLKWTPVRPVRSVFVSLEMHHATLMHFLDTMDIQDPDGLMRQNFHILPLGHGISINNAAIQGEISTVMDEFEPDIVIFDSFSKIVNDDLNSDKVVLGTFKYIEEVLKSHYGSSVGFIHHNRKAQIGNKKPKSLDDVFGSQFYGATIDMGIGLWPAVSEIEVNCLKHRLAEEFQSFNVKRMPNLEFDIVSKGPRSMNDDSPIFGGDDNDGLLSI